MNSTIVLIPARYQSTRFPGKPLSLIKGKSMIQRVFENVASSGFESAVVTDDARIEEHVAKFNGKVLRVDDNVPSGTERIAIALERFYENKYKFAINVQGDEPLLKGDTLKKLVKFHQENQTYGVTTLYRKRFDKEIENPDIVKIALSDTSGECLYFSRSGIPYDRDKEGRVWYQHIGVYCYQAEVLKKFTTLEQTSLEKCEKLEQLRALENKIKIGAIEVDYDLIGVDRLEDIKLVEKFL